MAVVIGAERDRVMAELVGTKVFLVENETWQRGIGNSIRAGLREFLEAYPNTEAVILLACDQPLIESSVIAGLMEKRMETRKPIVASSYAETLGIPALFSRSYFDELQELDDDTGAKQVILNHSKDVAEYPFPDGAIDIDTAADYQELVRQNP